MGTPTDAASCKHQRLLFLGTVVARRAVNSKVVGSTPTGRASFFCCPGLPRLVLGPSGSIAQHLSLSMYAKTPILPPKDHLDPLGAKHSRKSGLGGTALDLAMHLVQQTMVS